MTSVVGGGLGKSPSVGSIQNGSRNGDYVIGGMGEIGEKVVGFIHRNEKNGKRFSTKKGVVMGRGPKPTKAPGHPPPVPQQLGSTLSPEAKKLMEDHPEVYDFSPIEMTPERQAALDAVRARPDWDTYFLNISKAVSTRADCRRSRVGAVIVKDHRIVSTGYNGSPAGDKSCLAGECPRGLLTGDQGSDYSNCLAIHAEANALVYANRSDCENATLYVTREPCTDCAKLIRASGIKRVVIG